MSFRIPQLDSNIKVKATGQNSIFEFNKHKDFLAALAKEEPGSRQISTLKDIAQVLLAFPDFSKLCATLTITSSTNSVEFVCTHIA
jgi:hypothetical protein